MKLTLSFWRNAKPKQKRVYSVLLVLLVAVIVLVVGSSVPLSYSAAEALHGSLRQTLTQAINNNDLVQSIYFNNLTLCLLMFLPLLGSGLGLFVLYNTGVGLNAISMVQGQSTLLGVLDLMAGPVFWLEFFAYSIAMAQSIWLFRRMLQGRWNELEWTGLSIVVSTVLLAVGAVVEAWQITGHI
ncbi:MAG: hypothetical protein ACQCN6_05565 [Candidatus Bathyarchaeia archaeon]|jgi:hypothetical protein